MSGPGRGQETPPGKFRPEAGRVRFGIAPPGCLSRIGAVIGGYWIYSRAGSVGSSLLQRLCSTPAGASRLPPAPAAFLIVRSRGYVALVDESVPVADEWRFAGEKWEEALTATGGDSTRAMGLLLARILTELEGGLEVLINLAQRIEGNQAEQSQ